MEIGEKLKELRIQRGLTQEELADRCELSKGFISQVERELASPSIATLKDMLECLGVTLQGVSVLCLLFINRDKILTIDLPGEGRFDGTDTLLGEIPLLGIGGEDDHMDVDAVFFFVECGIPPQMVRMDLIAAGKIADGGVHQGTPILRISIPEPLRILPPQRYYRRPHVSGMLSYFTHSVS